MDDLEGIIDKLYEDSIIKYESKQERRTNIHVSDLTSECMRKPWYRLRDYNIPAKTFEKALPLVHGTMLHECVNLDGVEHELQLAANVRTMMPVDYMTKPRKVDRYDCVQGSIDDIIEIDDEYIICDKKTTRQIPKEVPLNYQIQLNIYKLLYFVNYGLEVNKGAIIYIDKTSGWSKHKTLMFDLLESFTIRELVLDKLDELKKENIPERVESFLCNWCPFYDECKPNVFKRSNKSD